VTIEERFWIKVDIQGPDDCWEWRAGRDDQDRGCFNPGVGLPTARAHKFAYELVKGPIPQGLCVCHTCDNPPCCNPNHLFPGTRSDNMQDMMRKGRKDMSGEHQPRHKLTAVQITEIRQRGEIKKKGKPVVGLSPNQLAVEYGVTPCQIRFILRGESWKNN